MALSMIALVSLGGCPTTTTTGTTAGGETLKVSFDAKGGNFAVATDSQGNQYTFKAREGDGGTTITEANIVTKDGQQLKVSLDSAGRPVNVRLSDNTAADLVYDQATGNVSIRLTDANGGVVSSARQIKPGTQKAEVQQRQAAAWGKALARAQGKSSKVETLQKGLAVCEQIIESVCDPNSNPSSPLAASSAAQKLTTNLKTVGRVASTEIVDEVLNTIELGETVTADVTPDIIKELAGKTFKLFDAEGFCLELTDTANILTFDGNGTLLTEFDRHMIFPDFSTSSEQERGLTINYVTLTELNLTAEDIGFDLTVTPIFTGTQLDDADKITIERRFNAHLSFPVEVFVGQDIAEAHKLFDAALINGELSEDGAVLAFELVLVDLDESEGDSVGKGVYPVAKLRYHDQGARVPARIYEAACEQSTADPNTISDDPTDGITCPTEPKEVAEDFEVQFNPGSLNLDDVQLDWYISSGTGYISGEEDTETTTVVATTSGFIEITLLVHDMTDPASEVVRVYTCTIAVGTEEGGQVGADELVGYCPTQFVMDETADAWVEGAALDSLVYIEWYVLGAWQYYIDNVSAPRTGFTFWETGFFTVVFYGVKADGTEIYLWLDVEVVASGETEYGENIPPSTANEFAGNYTGELTNPAGWAHTFEFTVADDGTITGVSTWPAVEFNLEGYVDSSGASTSRMMPTALATPSAFTKVSG
jgi:hypothetical protein